MGHSNNQQAPSWHDESRTVGVLIANLGTPSAPTPRAVRRFLYDFLSDTRVIDLPRWVWLPILYGIILPFRPSRVARNYQKIWTDQGSPLLVTSQQQASALQTQLSSTFSEPVHVELGLCYSKPGIATALHKLRDQHVRHLIVLPMYPQYSATTSAAVFDQVSDTVAKWRWLPQISFINEYASEPGYIAALAASVKQHWQQHQRGQCLVFSFHGLPKRHFKAGDPYYCFCHKTARLVADELGLVENEWRLVFQSRVGREEWLQPYCDVTLKQLPGEGVTSVDVVCPGFAVDCLETLEEINITNRKLFTDAGGEAFEYIPALNASDAHIKVLADVVGKCFAAF